MWRHRRILWRTLLTYGYWRITKRHLRLFDKVESMYPAGSLRYRALIAFQEKSRLEGLISGTRRHIDSISKKYETAVLSDDIRTVERLHRELIESREYLEERMALLSQAQEAYLRLRSELNWERDYGKR